MPPLRHLQVVDQLSDALSYLLRLPVAEFWSHGALAPGCFRDVLPEQHTYAQPYKHVSVSSNSSERLVREERCWHLSTALCSSHAPLLCNAVVHDPSIGRSLDTYLRFKARPFDVDSVAPQPLEAASLLSRRMFMLALRLCAGVPPTLPQCTR